MKLPVHRTEPGLLRIFRYFSGGVSLVFLMMRIAPGPWGSSDPIARKSMLSFSITYGFIFLYLLVPRLEKKLKVLYLPPVLIAASIIPIAIINAKYRALLAIGLPINNLDDTMTITIMLIFPLIATAWQYSFPIVFLFFVVLGFLDPLLIILVNESFTPAIFGAFNASLVRILGLGAVGFMITELREQQRSERAKLEDANRKLEEYAKASEKLAVSRERNRLARDLHDTLAHTLSGLAIQLEATDTVVDDNDERLGEMVKRARLTVQEGLGETRRALKALRASSLEDLGLILALRRLADDASGRGSLDMEIHLPDSIPDWPEGVLECSYRITQEALENVVRHAEAKRVKLTLSGDENRLDLSISDDGIGFDLKDSHGELRFGIRGMQERAGAVGGSLTIQNRSNQNAVTNNSDGFDYGNRGTEVCFKWRAKT